MEKVFLLLCFVASNVYSQSLTKEDVLGIWICKHVSLSNDEPMSPEMKAMAEKVKEGFVGGKFTLGSNGIFNMQLLKAGPELLSMLDFVDNRPWFIKNNRISISPQENLMHMDVTRGDGFLLFALYETPFILRMEKI